MKWFAFCLGLLLTFAAAIQFPRERILRGQNDFLAFYCGSKLSGTGNLRSIEASKEIAVRETGVWVPAELFIRPDYYAILLRPLGWFPYATAYAIFQALSLIAAVLALWLAGARSSVWMLAACSIPLVTTFVNGQDVMFLGLAFAATVLLERRGFGFAAGLALSLCTVKFHLFLFVPLALLAHRKWRIIAGAGTGTALATAIAALVEGPGWMLRYVEFLRRPELHPLPFPVNFHSAVLLLGWSALAEWVLAGAVAACLVWLAWQRLPFGTLMALCLTGGLLVSWHLGMQDYALLLVCAALSGGLVRHGFCWLAAPPLYILMLFPEPWNALAVLAMCTVFTLPFFELYGNPFRRAQTQEQLQEAL